ncbi:MAG: hypothetical protein E1N59_3189 [Puniceicoccaceae bacterium 5H]|nr:MAG: hypothetical protein E1N59_3189 [Puniceicoccaceae bacterium 5H]
MDTLLVNGLSIAQTSTRLRNLVAVERARLKILAGWFLRLGDFERKYKLAYHLYDAAEHVTWMRARLKEMRSGNPDASIRPELKALLEEVLHAPDDTAFLQGFYGVLTRQLVQTIEDDLTQVDPVGNANEHRLLRRILLDLQAQVAWYDSLPLGGDSAWAEHVSAWVTHIGGIHGQDATGDKPAAFAAPRFERPATIVFDDKITIGSLASYEDRLQMSPEQATVEQFRVFFNEFYAAALLASILFDASDGDYPWEFFADFSRHFWDEARHSEFGTVRLRELGVEPDRVNPILYEESQGLPVLHRVAYLTRGLEAYFMPRKPKRMKEYETNGDDRSQLFADQDWSDEINHVRYGSRWTDHLLEEDYRDVQDVIEEVKQHLTRMRGTPVTDINAPF